MIGIKKFTFKKEQPGQEPKQMDLTVEKLALSNMVTIEALIELLASKGLLTKEELVEEIRKIGKNTKIVPLGKEAVEK